MSLIKKLFLKYKYRNFSFGKEGINCKYRYLNSNFSNPHKIELGDNVFLGPGTELYGAGEIKIGNGVIFAPDVCIYSRTHNFDSPDLKALPYDNRMLVSKVFIGDYVWIGKRVIILPGVKIGKGAVIGAGSIISKDIPDYAIAVGNPAKIIKYRNSKIFNELHKKDEPFVYNIFGHKKSFIIK